MPGKKRITSILSLFDLMRMFPTKESAFKYFEGNCERDTADRLDDMLAWNEEEYAWHERIPWALPKPSIRFESTAKVFTKLRAKTDWLQALPFGAVRHTLKHQEHAWIRYFKKQGGRPKFKSKYHDRSLASGIGATGRRGGDNDPCRSRPVKRQEVAEGSRSL